MLATQTILARADLARVFAEAGDLDGAYTLAYFPGGYSDEPTAAIVVDGMPDFYAFLVAAADVLGKNVAMELANHTCTDRLGFSTVVYFDGVGVTGPEQGPGSVRRGEAGESHFFAVGQDGGEQVFYSEAEAWEYAQA